MNKKIKYILLGVMLLLVIGTGVYAATSILSKDVTYDNSNSTLTSTNVQDALDELYTKINSTDSSNAGINFAAYIKFIYNNAAKTEVTNNSITYNYATSLSLMNDRLGGTTTGYDGGNIRYYGASPNNYIYFNCSDYSNQSSSTCELWRVIGVFDGKVKIIRDSSIGSLAWDQDENQGSSLSTYNNDWTTSSLQEMLNNSYYNGDTAGTITYYSELGKTTTSLNMSSIGLKNDTTRNMIETVTWNLGGWNTASGVYSNKLYEYERGTTVYNNTRPTTWTGKIALMYPSDYGYATDFNKCTKDPYNYNSSDDSYACRTNDWLFNSAYQWLLTPNSGSSSYAWYVAPAGRVGNGDHVYNTNGVRPVFYLNSELSIGSGTGTSGDPYRISV